MGVSGTTMTRQSTAKLGAVDIPFNKADQDNERFRNSAAPAAGLNSQTDVVGSDHS